MNPYIGAKIILAEPMSKRDFTMKYRSLGPRVPEDHNREGYHVVYSDNYHSWSPKEVFEEAYRLVSDGEKKLMTDTK